MTNEQTMELDLNPLRSGVIAMLKEGICEITFVKVNGERRVMPCTLKEDLLPAKKEDDSKELTHRVLKDKETDVISVWCTDKAAWRSFKLTNFISINPLYEYKYKDLDSNT